MPTVLLVHCDGTNGSTAFTDVSPSAHILVAANGAAVNTTSPKFGSGSADFSTAGTSPSINAGSSTDWNFGAGQFTVEAWVYYVAANNPSGLHSMVTVFGFGSNYGWWLGTVPGTLHFIYSLTGSDNPSVNGPFTPTLNTWYHIAADRDASNVLRVYANGAVVGSATVGALYASTQSCLIGNDNNLTRNFPGRIDEVRVTKGNALYAGAFTPPTGPFGSVAAREYAITVNSA